MPRPNPPRSLQSEANLARRIAHEREKRGWTYEGTAKRLTDAGCPIQASAIYKLEKADPPRRITVTELVAFAEVFAVPVEQLLIPVELLEAEAVSGLFLGWEQAKRAARDAAEAEQQQLATLRQYVQEHPATEEHLQKFVRTWVDQWSDEPDEAETLWMYTFTGSKAWRLRLAGAFKKANDEFDAKFGQPRG